MYAVMGITGNVGGAVARTLLAKGEKVRGIVRNPERAAGWQKQGVELFKADYDDVDALTAAFTGVAGVRNGSSKLRAGTGLCRDQGDVESPA